VRDLSRLGDYYRQNSLYESHRLLLPEFREKVINTCSGCRYFVLIAGRSEKRWGCAAALPRYAGTGRRVPEEIPLAEVLWEVGRDGLAAVLAAAPEKPACGLFGQRPGAKR